MITEFVKYIRSHAATNMYTQVSIAEKTGFTIGKINKMYSGYVVPSIYDIYKLSHATGLDSIHLCSLIISDFMKEAAGDKTSE